MDWNPNMDEAPRDGTVLDLKINAIGVKGQDRIITLEGLYWSQTGARRWVLLPDHMIIGWDNERVTHWRIARSGPSHYLEGDA
jgi:hypothetical protein